MSSQDEMVATFLSLTGGDSQEFARSFLESTGWNVEMAVGMMLDGGGPPAGGGGGGGVPPMLSPDGDALMGGASPNVRAPIPQMRDQLISHDPAQRGPGAPPLISTSRQVPAGARAQTSESTWRSSPPLPAQEQGRGPRQIFF